MFKIALAFSTLFVSSNFVWAGEDLSFKNTQYINIEKENVVKYITFKVDDKKVNNNATVVFNSRSQYDKELYVYCLVEKYTSSDSIVKKTCINEFGEQIPDFVRASSEKLDNVRYLDYSLPQGQQLKSVSLATVDLSNPYISYIKKNKSNISKKYMLYGFNPITGDIKQNLVYVIK